MNKGVRTIKPYKSHNSVYFCIFILFLSSMQIWIAWNGRGAYIDIFASLCLWILIKINRVKLNIQKKNVFLFVILLLSYVYLEMLDKNTTGIVASIFGYILPVSLILFLNSEEQVRCLNYIVKWFAILMIPSIITFLLCQTIGLPSFGLLKWGDNSYSSDYYLFRENYIFCTIPLKEVPRFNGPFNEPGHLGMMAAFLLFADGYNFKKKSTWVILLSLLMSLSLSGYVLGLVGYLFVKYDRRRIKLKFIVLFLMIILSSYFFTTFYNGGDNLINEKIVSRLELDDENGITGNNRVHGDIHLYFGNMFKDSRLLLFGYDRNTVDWLRSSGSGGTGMEMYIVVNGIFGFFLSISFYLVCFLYRNPKKPAALYFLFMFLLLLQRSYWYWFSIIICYLYGFTYWNRGLNQVKREKLRLWK